MKIRYAIKNKHTGVIHFKWYTITQIEVGLSKLFDTENYDIISRDRFSGMTDINGREIYENDICKFKEHNYKAKIIFWNQQFCFDSEFPEYTRNNPLALMYFEDCEVVSNIHKNTKS